ncbi:hypothetical protein [Prevotella intermedia]|uniref:hypothetical protein n=1 Tax=Prevotella intermedia TaxID=28131 RepID=UPI000BE74725|nr:hypothetical protein [Prevotella intermedia]PDP80642.1 hypothetical protein CLI69_11225 [Prevotella intermedia]
MRKLLLIAMAGLLSLTASAQKLRGHIEGGYTFGSGDSGRLELVGTIGGDVDKYFRLGGGLGFNYYTDIESFTMPVFANAHVTIPVKGKIKPYIDLKPGYGASLEKGIDGGFYFSGTTGIKFSNVTIGIGYASQRLSWDYNDYIRISATYDGLTVKVGYEF